MLSLKGFDKLFARLLYPSITLDPVVLGVPVLTLALLLRGHACVQGAALLLLLLLLNLNLLLNLSLPFVLGQSALEMEWGGQLARVRETDQREGCVSVS